MAQPKRYSTPLPDRPVRLNGGEREFVGVPRRQNQWVGGGRGDFQRSWSSATSKAWKVRTPWARLGVHRTLLLRPSTGVLEGSPFARNQLSMRGSWRRTVRATFFLGPMRGRRARAGTRLPGSGGQGAGAGDRAVVEGLLEHHRPGGGLVAGQEGVAPLTGLAPDPAAFLEEGPAPPPQQAGQGRSLLTEPGLPAPRGPRSPGPGDDRRSAGGAARPSTA